MTKSLRALAALAPFLALASQPALADDAAGAARGFAGSGQLGFVAVRGNTDSDTLNAALTGKWTGDRWSYEAGITALRAEEGGDKSADRWRLTGAVHRELGERQYVFASGRYLDDAFGAFATQAALSVGYGRHLLTGEAHALDAELGLGYRESEACAARDVQGGCAATAPAEGESLATGRLDYRWQISETASLTDLVRLEHGEDNTYFEHRLALTVRVVQALSLQLAWELQRNSDVPAGSARTDTLTTVSLVVDF